MLQKYMKITMLLAALLAAVPRATLGNCVCNMTIGEEGIVRVYPYYIPSQSSSSPPPQSPPPSPSSTTPNTRFIIRNNCPYTVWFSSYTQTGGTLDPPSATLTPSMEYAVNATSKWSGRMWARTGCKIQGENLVCETGDCRPRCDGTTVGELPTTVAEIALDAFGGMDFYDVSLVDGFNVPITITPISGNKSGHGTPFDCGIASCKTNVNTFCPMELQYTNANGIVVGCRSACDAFKTDEYCCSGNNNTPQSCPPSPYSKTFKAACPSAYSYAFDDETSTFTCREARYLVTFCG